MDVTDNPTFAEHRFIYMPFCKALTSRCCIDHTYMDTLYGVHWLGLGRSGGGSTSAGNALGIRWESLLIQVAFEHVQCLPWS
jgi:hypothetical protein